MTLRTQLDVLELSGLIRLAQAQPELEYLFRHVMVQEAAYSSLLKQQRRALHLAIGEALEQAAGASANGIAAMLAHHFDEAEDAPRALRYHALAGDESARKFAAVESLSHYSRALALALETGAASGEVTRLYAARGRAMEMSGDYAAALENYRAMELCARERADQPMELVALMVHTTIHAAPTNLFDAAEAQSLSEQALVLARALHDQAAEAKINWNLLLVNKFAGHFAEALAYGERSAEIAREFGLREQLAFTLNDVYQCYMIFGQFERGEEILAEARTLWEALGNKPMLADSLNNAAEIQWVKGKSRQALTLANEALALSRLVGNLWGQSYSQLVGGFAQVELAELGAGLRSLEESVRLGHLAGFAVAEVAGRAIQAIVYLDIGDTDQARELARESMNVADQKVPAYRSIPLSVMAGLQLRDNLPDESEATIEMAMRELSDLDLFSQPFLAAIQCEIALMRGDAQRALKVTEPLLTRFSGDGMYCFVPEMRYYHARAQGLAGNEDAAYAEMMQARDEAMAYESYRVLWRILAALAVMESERGDVVTAERLREESRGFVRRLAGTLPSDALRALLFAQPQVRAVMGG